MVRFGLIGTGSISDVFMEAANGVEDFKLTAVYSRSRENGEAFAKKYDADFVYTSLEELASSSEVDAVYIASPNHCHAAQSILMMNGKKHVLCEKPVASDEAEFKLMLAAAAENQVIMLEAMRPAFDPGFAKIQELLPSLGMIRQASLAFGKYSSRYNQFKEGVVMNAFNPAMSNAAVMDIGVYCIHPMIKLFGKPDSLHCNSVFLDNGMEGAGTIIAAYEAMQVVLQYSKISNNVLSSQIQGEEATMIIREIPDTKEIELRYRDGRSELFKIEKKENNMYYEIDTFIRMVQDQKAALAEVAEHNRCSLLEMQVMDEVRALAGINFN